MDATAKAAAGTGVGLSQGEPCAADLSTTSMRTESHE